MTDPMDAANAIAALIDLEADRYHQAINASNESWPDLLGRVDALQVALDAAFAVLELAALLREQHPDAADTLAQQWRHNVLDAARDQDVAAGFAIRT